MSNNTLPQPIPESPVIPQLLPGRPLVEGHLQAHNALAQHVDMLVVNSHTHFVRLVQNPATVWQSEGDNKWSVVPFDYAEDGNAGGEYDFTTQLYTCPADGVYQCCGYTSVTSASDVPTTGRSSDLSIWRNGFLLGTVGPVTVPVLPNVAQDNSISISVWCMKGWTLQLRHQTPYSQGLDSQNRNGAWFSIAYLGYQKHLNEQAPAPIPPAPST